LRIFAENLIIQVFYIMIDIKQSIKNSGVGITELADKLNVSRQTVHYYINQGNKNSIDTLEKIAAVLGISVADFFTPACSDDFTAFVSNKGEMVRLNSVSEFKKYADSLS